ncbi:MAG: hypothetical protein R3E12_19115 [Candidatus Eisenbacteria bacterium]
MARQVLGGLAAVRVEVHNWTDVRIQDLDGFPLPGRSFYFQLETHS